MGVARSRWVATVCQWRCLFTVVNSKYTRFFHEELSWTQSKVDDLLLPIIRKMGQRGQVGRELQSQY